MVDDIDDYGHRVNKGVMHLEGNFLEKNPGSDRIYKVSKKKKEPFSIRKVLCIHLYR